MKFGVWTTAVVVIVFAWLMFGPVPNGLDEDLTKWGYLWTASPNELGDTLAGFAGTLAFLWIIVTVMLQSRELAAQRKELRLTRIEFSRMSKAQDAQVALMDKQGAIFQKEQKERDEERARKLLDHLIIGLSKKIEGFGMGWLIDNTTDPMPNRVAGDFRINLFTQPYLNSNTGKIVPVPSGEEGISSHSKSVGSCFNSIRRYQLDGRLKQSPDKGCLEPIRAQVKKISVLNERLSEDQRERLNNMGLPELADSLEAAMSLDVWKNYE